MLIRKGERMTPRGGTSRSENISVKKIYYCQKPRLSLRLYAFKRLRDASLVRFMVCMYRASARRERIRRWLHRYCFSVSPLA